MNNKQEAFKFKDFPEGSLSKKYFDSFFMSTENYLEKYYQEIDLTRWNYINSKFVTPMFDGTSWEVYMDYLKKAKPNFLPIEIKVKELWIHIQDDNRFSLELKHFFCFLYSIDFFKELNFEEWLNVPNWRHPWYLSPKDEDKSILELLNYKFSENYLKEKLATLSIF